MTPVTEGIVIAVAAVAGLLLILSLMGSIYRKVGPNRALIVFGKGGTKVVVGGGAMIVPLFQRAQEFNLELMSFDVAPSFLLYTTQGMPVKVEAITQLKVENEAEKIKRAANQFLSKTEDERETDGAPGDGGSPARHRRAAHGGAACEGPGDGLRAHARDRGQRPG